MATSVALAVSFPYQGSETYLRSAKGADGGGDVTVEKDIVLEDITVVVDGNVEVDAGEEMSGVDSSNNETSNILSTENDEMSTEAVSSTTQIVNLDASSTAQDEEHNTVMMDGDNNVDDSEEMSDVDSSTNGQHNQLPTENDETTTEQVSPTEQANNAAASFTAQETEKITEIINGLFGPIATVTDEELPNNEQANTTTSDTHSGTTTNSEYSSCQMELQQADANLDNIIDAYEYITFLYNVGSISLSTIQFDELPSEYQVNFDHLATTNTESGGSNNVGVGIPIGTVEEVQRVCVYISKKGSSAVGEFDWDQISSLP